MQRQAWSALALVIALGGCSHYSWHHSSKSVLDFEEDRSACKEQSFRDQPVRLVDEYVAGSCTPGYTSCAKGALPGGPGECTYNPGLCSPGYIQTVDKNEPPRKGVFDSCLRSAGWQWLKDD